MRQSFTAAAAATWIAGAAISTAAAADGPSAPAESPADSDSQLAEIIVTAERREANIQRVPIAISTVSADSIAKAGVVSLSDLSSVAPSFRQAPYVLSSAFMNMFMRGQGTGDAAGVARDGGVGIYLDGFYQSRPQAALFDLGDIERIEVLRGPQGTLYGRNVVGGAVNVVSKAPSGEFKARAQVSGGNYGYHREFVTIDSPTWNNVSAKLTLLNSNFDGWNENIAAGRGLPGDNNFAENEQAGGKLQLRWKPSDQFMADYSFTGGRLTTTQTYSLATMTYGFPTPGRSSLIGVAYPGTPLGTAVAPYVYGAGGFSNTYRPMYVPESVTKFYNNGLTLSYDVNENLQLRSLTGYNYLDAETKGTLGEAFIAVEFDSGNNYLSHQFTQEFQAIGSAFNSQLKYTGGLYFFRESVSRETLTDSTDAFGAGLADIPGFGLAHQSQFNRSTEYLGRSYAAYGQATWTPPAFDNRLDLTAGVRYTKDKKDATIRYDNFLYFGPSGIYADRTFNVGGPCVSLSALCLPVSTGIPNIGSLQSSNTSPSFTAQYQLTDDLNIYAKYAKGYKAGGISEGASEGANAAQIVFQPEKATSYELGLKSEFFDRHVRLNLAAFHAQYNGLQLDFNTSISDPNSVAIFNVGKAEVDGVEGDFNVAVTHDLKFAGTFGWSNGKVKAFAPAGSLFDPAVSGVYNAISNPQGSVYTVGGDISRQFRLTFLPKWTASFNADWTFWRGASSDLSVYGAYVWQADSATITNTGPGVINADFGSVPAYGLFDGRFSYGKDLSDSRRLSVSLWGKNLADRRYRGWVTALPGAGPQTPATVLILSTYNQGMPRTFGAEVNISF